MKTIYLGADHGGFELKEQIKTHLETKGEYDIQDLGAYNEDSVDYPAFGRKVGESVVADEGSLGIIVCGTGVGISIAANKVSGVRCALVNSIEVARLTREHNDANVLALGGRSPYIDTPLEVVDTFLNTETDTSERHARRRESIECGCCE